ncbi:FadR/GntR family transcriptional regulator [Alicyclobacillus mengziensis]|uniref:FadR family transcriptional regulator n=1 Tax=Alicyclobacillus mengziensis TaxID=2931921 RepID=A0A9X7Z855_9BACL|nr:FadR/GntR family transcriptional regulator [Alicyclobacillus mengziensis]QSO49262.1 FadR family transcriptional regulator [Alicyclobacillus mengziensis]
MSLLPVSQSPTYELVIERLKGAILDGTFQPSERIPSVKSLAETLGVGQSAVREAISALRILGLLEVKQGDGTFVAKLDSLHLAESISHKEAMSKLETKSLLELRMSIETGTSRYAALRRTDEQLREMEAILQRMEEETENAELGEEADWEFHYAIARASHNPYMRSIMDDIAERMKSSLRTSRLTLYRIPGENAKLIFQHRQVLSAIRERDPERASYAMHVHLEHVSDQLSGGNPI